MRLPTREAAFVAMVVLFAQVAPGCSGKDDTGPSGEPEADAASAATLVLLSSLTMADSLFQFDPDLNPDGTAAQNLDTIKGRLTTDGGGCVSVTVNQGGVKADFGAGCTLQSGLVVSGVITIQVSRADASRTLTVNLGFESLVVDGVDLDGTMTFVTTTGSTFTVALDLAHAGAAVAANLTVTGAPGTVTVDGTASYTAAGATAATAVTLAQVTFAPGACYPNGGSISSGGVSLTFDAQTPTTGQATLAVGPISSCYALPATGTCTPTACPSR